LKKEDQNYLSGVILTNQLKNSDTQSQRLKTVGKLSENIAEDWLNYVHTYLT